MKTFKYKITLDQAHELLIVIGNQLKEYGYEVIDETPRRARNASGNVRGGVDREWYRETSLTDGLVRQYIRLRRITLGNKQFNKDPGFKNGV